MWIWLWILLWILSWIFHDHLNLPRQATTDLRNSHRNSLRNSHCNSHLQEVKFVQDSLCRMPGLTECEINSILLTTWAIWKPQFSEQLPEQLPIFMGTHMFRAGKKTWTRKHINKIFTGLSRDYPGTVPAFSWDFLGILFMCFPFPPGKGETHKQLEPHPFPGQSHKGVYVHWLLSPEWKVFIRLHSHELGAPETLRAQILKNFKIFKFSSELEIFKRATRQTPIFCGEFWRSGLKISSEIEIFKRDWKFQAILNFFQDLGP